MSIAEALAALLPSLAKIIENAISDTYDKDAELQAMLDMQRDIADARVASALASQG